METPDGWIVRAELHSDEGLSAVGISTAPMISEQEAVAEFTRFVSDTFGMRVRQLLLDTLARETEITRPGFYYRDNVKPEKTR